jgi:diguanylate cyclase (GGDEF)-like protein
MLGGSVRPAGTGRLARREILRPRRFIFSLQAKILVVVLLCVAVPLLLMGAYLLDQTQAALEAKAKESLFRHLFARASEITEWMKDRLDEPARWSTTFIAYDALEARADGKPNAPRLRGELQAYLDDVHSRYEQLYESLFVVDLEGQVVVGSRKEVLEDWAVASLPRKPSDAEAARAQDAGKPGVLTPMWPSGRLGRPTLLALHRIERAGRVVGYFVARVDTRDLERLLASPAADAKAHFWLLDREERVLIGAEPGGGPVAGERFAPEGPPSTSTAPVQEGVLPGVGESVYGKLPLPDRPFPGVLAATVSREGVYQPLAEARKRLLRAGIPSVFVIFLLAYVLARGMLRPILLLSEGAQRVSAGDLDVHLPVHGRDELADLTSAFNEMARRVRDSRDELAESATALARTNDQLEQAKERFRSQAITDALTGIFNRRHFEDCLDEQIARAAEEAKPLSLLLLDLDHFKQFNDRWGHTEGDAELRRVAALVQRTVRSTDIAFRYGGEELAVLLPACSKEQAMVVAEKVRIAVGSGTQRPTRFGARTTVSAGVATYPEDGRVARGLVDTADAALYQAKAQGRDRVVAAGGPSQGPPDGERKTG